MEVGKHMASYHVPSVEQDLLVMVEPTESIPKLNIISLVCLLLYLFEYK